ncbi:Ig-like domain-containing protein [Escherichia coli]
MVGKAHGNGDRRGDNTICGLGDRLRRLTAGICLITQTIFPVMAAAPTHINPAHSDTAASLILPNVKTIPYTLGALESPPTVAARFGITVDELRRLNQFRTFARGFDNVRQGDEIDVPLINSNSPEARNLKAMQMERDGKDPQMQVAEVAQQSGTLLARDMDSEQAASMARGWVASSASAQATDWLSRWGTARVSLGVDEDFSLKSSSFEFLHPWYETPDNLVFSQHTLHRTDDRTQTNHGIGWRYFTPSWMSGVNMFIDHDLTRYHTRTGMGVEYWRNYLKLSGNGYLRLSNWRSAPELDNDYEARPANGWDLRAEGWLPAWPQLGGKLVYEQYYGDEVALFGKDERQNDPHAITAGLSYTPVPLISFSAEQRQGKQGENDTRIGMELTLQPGHSLQKQLDPAEVAARRSLVGSRYDLVDRNNNIVLEYRKKELVRLTLTDPLKGKPGEVKSLVSSLQTKYALKGYDIEAASLQSAGGKVAVSGKDIQVTIPPYRFTAMPETDNTYPIAVTAEDSKGNFSRREESMVVVEKPTLSLADSTLSVDLQILLADGKSTSTLTYTARDSSGKPIPGMTLKTQVKGLQDFALSEWKDNGNGTYTQIVTAGKTSGALSLMPQFNGDDIAKTPALIAIVANTASRADSTIETDQDNYVAGKPIVVKVTLRDDNGNGVTGRKELLKQTVKVDNTKADAVSAWTEESEGIYKASYTAHLIGDKLTAQLTMPGWQTKHSDAFSIAGDKDTAKIAAMQITANNAVARRDHNTVAVTVRDVHQNLLQGQNVTFTVVNGAAVFADPNGGIVTTDKDGIASVNLASDQAVNSLIKAETNGSSQSVEVSFITGDISQLTSTIKTDDVSYTAGGKIKVSVTLMDEQKNLVKGMASLLAGSSVVEVSGTDKNETGNWSEESDGVYTTTRTAKIAGDRHYATLKLSTWSSAQQSDAYAIRESGAVLAYSSIVTDKTAYTAGGAIKVTVTLKDSYENLVGGQRDAINQAIQLPNTKAESIAWNEDQKGIYTATYTALLPGTGLKAQLQMSGWASALTSNDYSISGDAASAQIVAMQVTTGNPDVLANGSDRHTVNVRVEDQFGNVLPEQTVTFTVTKGAAVFANAGQSADIRTDAHGMAEVDLSSTVADASTVEAKINQSSDSKTVSFVADVSTAQVAELVVTQDGSVADGSTANTLRARVTDVFGNVLAGQTVSVLADNSATVAPTVITGPDGTVEISVTSQTAGTSAVTASINNSSQSRNVTFIADVRTAKIADLVVIKDGSEADGSTANTLRVRVTDAFGNALAGQTVSVLADNGATVTPTVITGQDGTVEISVTSQTAGVSAVTATINSSTQSQNVTFIADVRTAKIADLVVIKDGSEADGSTANTLRARVTDAFGNALAGQAVSVLAGNGATVAPTVITGQDGTVEISVTSQTAGVSAVTATINNSSLSRNVTFVADVRTAQIADLVVIKDDSVADGAMANTLRVKVTDAFGNALAGQTVSVLAGNGATTAPTVTTQPDGTVEISVTSQTVSVMAGNGATTAPTVTTQPDGTVEISVTSQTAGTSAVTASINSSSLSRNVTFVADVRTAKIASLEVTQDNSVTDGAMANTLRVKVTDAFGNALNGQTVSVMADNGATVAPTVITEPDGTVEISVTSQTAGISAVTASINSSSQSRDVTFIADVRTAKIAELEVIRDNAVADGSTANTLQVKVTDANGNTLAGQAVSVLADNGATVTPTVITGQDGTVEISITSQTAGTSTGTASINNSSLSRNVTFIADVRTAKIADLVVTRDNSVADGTTANTLRVKVTDAFGNALAGQTVSVMADNGATVAPTVSTKPDGMVELSVTSQTAGISVVTASINNSIQSQNVTFVADVSTAKIADLVVIKDGSEADGSTANTLRVRVTDAFGNTLAGQTVSVLADNGATVTPTVITGQDGTVEISVTSQTAGTSAVTATINSSSQSRDVTFVADVSTAQIADLVVIKDGSVADGAMANTLRVRVTDAFGNTLAGQTVSVLADNGATTAPTVITEPDGTLEISVTSQTAGVSAVTATINSSTQSQNVTFIADVRTAKIADLVVIKDGSEADGSTANTLRARVTDAFGNALAGQTVSVLADNGATVASTVTTEPDGTVEISVTSQTAGTSAVTASINNSTLSRNVTFIADVRTAKIADLVVIKDNSVADGAMANMLRARVTDAFGNALAGQTVSVLAGNGATTAPTVTTQPDGTVEISVTSQTAGISAVTATINNSTASQNVTFIADVRTAKIAELEVIRDNAVADGSTANTLQVKVTDANGNTLAGQTVSVLAGNSATVASTVTTEPDGTVEISVTSQTAGISTVNATINSSSQSRDVTFIADVRTAQIADLVVIKDGSEADGSTANTLRVRVTDKFGNVLAGQTVSVMADNGATVTPTVTTEPDGTVEISVTSQTAGISTVTATINNSTLSQNVTFIADVRTAKIADLVVIKDGSEADGSTANTLRVKVTDAFGNALAGQTVSVLADTGATVAPTVITGQDGTVEISVTSQTAGTSAVTASINSSTASRNVTFVADVRTAQIASLEVTQDNSVADGAMANTLLVRVTDAFGNTLAGQTVSVLADTGATVAPTVITGQDGTVEISVTSQTAGTSAVTASINNSSLSQSVKFIADVSTAQIASLEVTQDNSVADGAMANTLRVKVTDAFGNALGGQTVSVLADNGATTAPTVTTQPDGMVEISVTSQTAGTSVVTASINNSSQSRNVTFIADVSTAKIADLVVIKDDSVADGAMANTLQVKVTDAFGNTLAGQTVSVLADNGATVAPTMTTKPDGTVEISVTSQTAGISAVTATINNSTASRDVTFIADVRTAKIADLVVIKDDSVADGAMANMLRARVTDAFGNALAGQTVSVMAGNGATTAPTVTTQPDGTVEISVTSQTAGTSAVTASINSSTASRNVTFVADVSTAQIASLEVTQDNSVADGAMANMLRVRVTDAFGNALGGQTVSVLADNGVTTAPTVITEPDGTVEISVTSQTAGVSAVTATINSSSQSQNVTFIADVSTAKIADLVVIKDGSEADGSTANTLRARVTDAFGNALAGQAVSVMADNSATVAPTVTTHPDGTVEISVTSQTAGVSTVTASINSSSQSRDVTFIADASTAQIADLVVIKDGSEADGSTVNTLRARVTDAFGNTLGGQTVSVLADNGATVSPTVTTQPDGTVEISVTSQTAGTSTVTASINNSSQSRDVTFIADVRTAQIASLEVTQDNAVADGAMANTLRVRVTDAFGNTFAGQTVSVMADNGAAVASTMTTKPDGTVEISVTSQTAGISVVTASINNSSQSQNVTFVADVRTAQIADLVVIKDGSVADGAMANTLRARVTDAFGNALAGQTVSVLGGNGATTAPTVITGPDGTVEISVTSQTAGISTVTATINSSSLSRNVTFVADVSTAQIADLVVIKDGSVADGATANTLQVKVTDANGNTLAGQTVSVLAGNSATVASTVTTKPDGTVEISVTSQTAGTSTVTASINNSSLSRNVTFVPGDASQLTSTVETNKSNYTVGETITITVTLRDAFDNLVTGAASQLAADGVLTVAGTDPSETGSWVESGGVYTTTRMATIASTNQHANLQLQTWSDGVTSDRYDIQSGSPAQATSTIATDKNAYTAGDTITVAVTLKDAHGNLVEGGESLLSGDNVTVEGAVRSGGWSETAGVYTATWSAQMAGDSHHATLKLSEWGSSKQSESYFIHSGAPVQANSAIRTDKSAYIAGEPLTVTVTLRDEFGNPAFGLTSEVIESYIDNFAVGGATPDSMQWVEQNHGEYTIVWTAWVAEENLVASLKLKTWAAEIKSSLYGIQPGAAAKTQSTIVADKTIYIAGDSITVTVVLKDAQGNFITDGVVQLNEENVQVRNADPIQGNNWVYNGNGQYQRQYMAHFAEANLNAQLKMGGWSDANYSNNYTIKPGEVSPLGSQLRIREVLVVEGADLPVSALLVDDFGNPVDNGLDLLDDAVYLQNVEKKEGEKWRYVGDGIYERTYMAYQEGENLTSFMEIKGWRIYGQPSYTILPFVEVESLSVNGVKFRATDGFPETGFDGAKFTLLLTHNMKNTDYNWTAGIYGINVDSNGEVTLSVLIRSEVTITGKPKNGKGNDVVFKFKIKKWFTSLGATSSNTWDIINTSCSYGQMPSSLELAQRPSGGVVPRKVGTLWGEYGNLKTYGNAFSSTDYWTSTQLMGVHEKFNPETGISELGTGKSSGLCVEYY